MKQLFRSHQDHTGPFGRVARDVRAALDRMAGPPLSRRQLLHRADAEMRSDNYGNGIMYATLLRH